MTGFENVVPAPGNPGIPGGSAGEADVPNEQSNINELPVVEPTASEVVRAEPDPPESPEFFQIYADTGPDVGESPQ